MPQMFLRMFPKRKEEILRKLKTASGWEIENEREKEIERLIERT